MLPHTNVEFELARRDDLTVQLLEPKPESVVRTFEQLEGVRTVEPQRTVAIGAGFSPPA